MTFRFVDFFRHRCRPRRLPNQPLLKLFQCLRHQSPHFGTVMIKSNHEVIYRSKIFPQSNTQNPRTNCQALQSVRLKNSERLLCTFYKVECSRAYLDNWNICCIGIRGIAVAADFSSYSSWGTDMAILVSTEWYAILGERCFPCATFARFESASAVDFFWRAIRTTFSWFRFWIFIMFCFWGHIFYVCSFFIVLLWTICQNQNRQKWIRAHGIPKRKIS